jgi:hypothetical protein
VPNSRAGIYPKRWRARSWSDENYLCDVKTPAAPRKLQSRDGIDKKTNQSQVEWVVPDNPRHEAEAEALRTRSMHDRASDGRRAALQSATARLAAAAPTDADAVARMVKRVHEHTDGAVATAVAAGSPGKQNQPQQRSCTELERLLRAAEAENARLRAMPPMCSERVTMDPDLQRNLPKLTGTPSYGVHKAVVRLFHAYYPYGIEQYRGRASIPDNVFDAAIAATVKEGTPAPATELPWVGGAGSEGAGPPGGAAAVPAGRHGSGICGAEEEDDSEGDSS